LFSKAVEILFGAFCDPVEFLNPQLFLHDPSSDVCCDSQRVNWGRIFIACIAIASFSWSRTTISSMLADRSGPKMSRRSSVQLDLGHSMLDSMVYVGIVDTVPVS
jgi:hypothetical protein